jgi:hypothetical protein
MRSRRRLAATALLVVALAAGLAACGSDEPEPGAAQPTDGSGAPAEPAATDPSATGQAADPLRLENGRHPVVLTGVNVAGRTVTFDLIQWFSGDAAAKAAAEDGEESPPPNDYYIRNVNPRLRTLPVTGGARLTLTRLTVGPSTGNAAAAVEVDLATIADSGIDHVFWATVQGGQITRLEEQYVP